MYKITILKYEKNENYESDLAKWKEKQYGYRPDMNSEGPQPEKATRSLEVVLTEEEFKTVKANILEVFA